MSEHLRGTRQGECGALIRPDGCVAWAGQDLDAMTLVRALGTWFGQPV